MRERLRIGAVPGSTGGRCSAEIAGCGEEDEEDDDEVDVDEEDSGEDEGDGRGEANPLSVCDVEIGVCSVDESSVRSFSFSLPRWMNVTNEEYEDE